MNKTMEQTRARFALEFINSRKNEKTDETDEKDRLATLIQKAPVQILQNGLGQVLAFLLADNGGKKDNDIKASGRLYDKLQEWLCGELSENRPCRVYPVSGNLIDQLTEGDRFAYLRAQEETLALLNWMKKFAEAWLKEGEPKDAPAL